MNLGTDLARPLGHGAHELDSSNGQTALRKLPFGTRAIRIDVTDPAEARTSSGCKASAHAERLQHLDPARHHSFSASFVGPLLPSLEQVDTKAAPSGIDGDGKPRGAASHDRYVDGTASH